MTGRARHNPRRALAVGLALFGLFFQLLLPIPLAAAVEPGAPNRVLEICAADGIVRVPLPAVDQTGGDEQGTSGYVEACNHCVLHAAQFVLPPTYDDADIGPTANVRRLAYSLSDENPKGARIAPFDARGPPVKVPFRDKT